MSATRRTALAVFVITFVVYVFPIIYDLGFKPFFTWTAAQDVASTSLLPMSIIERGSFTLDPYWDFYQTNWHDPYFVAQVDGHIVSRSPVAAAVISVPFYGLPLASGWIASPPNAWLTFPWSGFFVAKFASVLFTACAVVMFFFCARELTDDKTSAALALVFAFGTSVWSTASQALWQQTPSVLFQTIGIWFLLRGRRKGANAVAPAAFFFSAATISRVNDGLTAILFTVYILIAYRSVFWRWVLWALPPALFFFGYNALYNGSPFVFGYQDGFLQYTVAPRLDALAGLFLSPSRGLLVYSPFFIFLFPALWLAGQSKERLFYAFCIAATAGCILILSIWEYWDGGWGYGTRMLTDVLPYMTLLLIPIVTRFNGGSRWAFGAMVVYAAVVQSFGLWDYGVRWHWHWANYQYNVWDVAENEPLFYLKQYAQMAQYFWGKYAVR